MGVLNGGGKVNRAVTLGIVIVAIVLVLFTVVNNQAKRSTEIVGQLTLREADGTVHAIGGESGRWTFVNIWASWCGPCQEEAPALVRVSKTFGDRVDFIGINATSEDTQADAEQFVATYQVPYTIVYDPKGEALETFQVAGYPTSYLLSPNGKIVKTFEGPYTEQDFSEAIETELKKG